MSQYPLGKGPPCPECKGKNEIRTRGAGKCGQCNATPGWHVPPEAKPAELTDRDRKLRRAADAARHYKKLYEAKIKEDAQEERLISLFQASIDALPHVPRALLKPPTVKPRVKHVETPVLAFGDLHVGQVISKAATHGINEFDFDIWQGRLEYLEGRVLEHLFRHQSSTYPELVVAGIGDNVSGRIHEELQKYGAQHVVDQVFVGATAVAVFLARLASHFESVRYVGISGNHGRLDKAKESSFYFKNFDYLFNSIIATRLKDHARISVTIPEAIFTRLDVAGQSILLSHGMELPPSSMGLPAYSINRASAGYQELLAQVGSRYDYWLLGHVHRPMELDAVIVNGCMSGYDEYAVGKLFKPIRPLQKLIGFREGIGKAWEYPIRLDLAPPAKVYRFSHDMGAVEALAVADEGAPDED